MRFGELFFIFYFFIKSSKVGASDLRTSELDLAPLHARLCSIFQISEANLYMVGVAVGFLVPVILQFSCFPTNQAAIMDEIFQNSIGVLLFLIVTGIPIRTSHLLM